MRWLDQIPITALIAITIGLGVAPVVPEPHLLEKLKMLADGTLSRPIDIFDLLMHAAPAGVLVLKLARMATRREPE